MQNYEFEILGTLPSLDAVVGVLDPLKAGGKPRIVVLVHTENLTDHKRRERLQLARHELVKGGMIAFPGARDMHDKFNENAIDGIKGSLQHPDYVEQMIDVLTEQTTQPLITLDAQNRECFWVALKVMGTDSRDLFAIAELGAFKPDAKTQHVRKPIGEAHILCRDIQEYVPEHTDYSSRDLVNMVRRASKIKLPTIDLADQVIASHYLRDLETNIGGNAAGSIATRMVKMRAALQFIGREKPEVMYLRQKEWIGMDRMREMMGRMDGDVRDSSYTRRFTDIPQVIVLRGNPRDVLTRQYKELYQFDADSFDFNHLLQWHDGYGAEELRFRGGIHQSPDNLALFETNIANDDKGVVMKYATLVLQEGNTLSAYNFVRMEREGEAPYVHMPNKMVAQLQDGSIKSLSIIDLTTDRTLYSGGRLSFSTIDDMVFVHVLSGIARMNEPDYSPMMFKSAPRGFTDTKKGRFPYFDYVQIDSFGPTTSFMRIGPSGITEEMGGMRFHLVRGHPRRLRDEEGTIREIIIIPPHTRGDIAAGVVGKGYRLDK